MTMGSPGPATDSMHLLSTWHFPSGDRNVLFTMQGLDNS